MLMQANADIYAGDNEGATPIELAWETDQKEVADELAKAMGDRAPVRHNSQTNVGHAVPVAANAPANAKPKGCFGWF